MYWVTGADGALASHVVERLIKDGGYNIHCLDLHIPKEEQRNHDVCSYIQTNITKYGDVESALEGMQAVFHVASITPIVDLFFSHDDYYRVNVTGTENIIRTCKVCNVQRLVYTSTSAVTKRIGLNNPCGATIWGQPPPIYMPKWVFVILAYVNEYFYKLTHIVLVSKFLSSISLGYIPF